MKKEIKRRHPAWFEIHPFGEVLPYAHNRITVDPAHVDRYGVPLPRIDYQIGENERKMTEHMADTVEEIVKAAGGVLVNYRRGELDAMGSAIHEHGTCRMGADPKRSALNALQPDARGEERVRRRRIGVSERVGEEPDADDSRAVLARDRPSGGGDQTWQPLRIPIVNRREALPPAGRRRSRRRDLTDVGRVADRAGAPAGAYAGCQCGACGDRTGRRRC